MDDLSNGCGYAWTVFGKLFHFGSGLAQAESGERNTNSMSCVGTFLAQNMVQRKRSFQKHAISCFV